MTIRAARRPEAPLYDARFEHDACGVGFVADAHGRSRERVLPLALSGLASLAHRGAFAADGESSDGAGVALPLERPLVERICPGLRGRPGVFVLFLPRDRPGQETALRLVGDSLGEERLRAVAWRTVPVEPDALGLEARATLPVVVQVVVPAPPTGRRSGFERSLYLARRRMEHGAARVGLTDFSVASASSRTVVYKGLVAGTRLGSFYPDLSPPLPLSYAVFHQRYATNTTPRWSLAQPFRLLAHNGEINTVRGNREQLRGRAATLGGWFGREVASLGPLLTADGSDSLSLDEALDLLVASGWSLEAALLAAIPESLPLRSSPHGEVSELQRRTAGLLAPWDGPAAIVFSDGRRVGAMLDRNGLRPAAYATTRDGLVTLASEAGAVPLEAAETLERGRLGPGEMLLVDPARRAVWHDAQAKTESVSGYQGSYGERSRLRDGSPLPAASARTTPATRWLAGLDGERLRVSVRAMATDAQEPLWSMGDDTPLPALARRDRPVTDHLRQSFAQVTNPAIDPDRERIVMDLRVQLGRRPPLLGPVRRGAATVELERPLVADLAAVRGAFESARGRRRVRTLDATWNPAAGATGLAAATGALAAAAVRAARSGVELLVISDRAIGDGRFAVPSVLAAGAVHSALTAAGLRGATDVLVDAADLLDVHTVAMALAAGSTAVSPWLALELAAEVAGSRGAETLEPDQAASNLLAALDRGLRKVLARMGISCIASYIGGQFFEVLELDREVAAVCFPAAPLWPGTVGFSALAERQLRRLAEARALPPGDRLPDPGFVRYRADGETHLYAPPVVKSMQAVAHNGANGASANGHKVALPDEEELERYRLALARSPALVRDQLSVRRSARAVPLEEVEPADRILQRFVSAAMSLGSLSPEAHQALTLGMRRIRAASNTGEGGEDPEWYEDRDGRRRDAPIKQVASARFGVTATYLSRAEQLEIKIAQGSKPGEGGQLPGRKVTPVIAALRRGQPGQSMISPPPHHDIYSIEDLAQLIADLRAVNPGARIGVKLVAALGVGTIAAGVAKAGADYVQISGHSGGTGASPLSSIKHAGIPWELGLAEAHQVLLRNGLRDRVALRTDGGLQTGQDVLVAAILGAEEFGFGTAALVALGCDMARQCHLDTCPTGIATQREDLRAKFTGTPEAVERFFRAIAQDVRQELASAGLRSVGEAVGAVQLLAMGSDPSTLELGGLLTGPTWTADDERRSDPSRSRSVVQREPASAVESRLAADFLRLPGVRADPGPPHIERVDHPTEDHPDAPTARITTADRAFGAHVSGLVERGSIRRNVSWLVEGSAGQSFGAFAGPSVELVLVGQANDYVAKGLSGGRVVLRPEPELAAGAGRLAIAGNTCLYGATAGRLHVVGTAGMRFAVRNSGAEAVVEGIGAHGCEYMTGGTVAILGPVGRNLGAGMSGGRVYLHDPHGDRVESLDRRSVRASRLSAVMGDRDDGPERLEEFRQLLLDHRDAGSLKARQLLEERGRLGDDVWLVEPLETAQATAVAASSPVYVGLPTEARVPA